MRLTLRQIDAEIAMRVMGWREKTSVSRGVTMDNYVDAEGFVQCAQHRWHPTTNPADMDVVLDKLGEKWEWQLFSPFGRVPMFSCGLRVIGSPTGAKFLHIAHAKTKALAVALCSLKTEGLDVEIEEEG